MRWLRSLLILVALGVAVSLSCAVGAEADGGRVGCTLVQKKGSDFLWVDYAVEGGPAAEAGIKKGDCVVAIDGVTTEKMSIAEGRRLCSGEIGSSARMTVRREGAADVEIVAVRGSILDVCSKAAAAGDPVAQYSVGYWYQHNTSAPDPAKAVEFYRKSADQGNAQAEVELGYMMKYGLGVPKDVSGGIEWYQKAARQGNAIGERDVGLGYLNGEGLPQSDKDAFAWLYSAAVQDDAPAEFYLGRLYLDGRGVAKDDAAGFAWYYRAAERNNAFAQWGLGYLYDTGRGVTKNYDEALRWYREAQINLPTVNKALEKAITTVNWEKVNHKGAEKGYIGVELHRRGKTDYLWVDYVAMGSPADEAGIKLDDCVVALNGSSTETMSEANAYLSLSGDVGTTLPLIARSAGATARELSVPRRSLLDTYAKAADAGDNKATFWVGGWYELSQTPKPDPAKAVESYRKAADRGYAPAQAQLGYMMKYGQGIPKDAKGGFAWFLKAARQGNAFAERELGLSYLFGDGVPKSDKDAFAWLYSAAVQDDSTAEHNLGYLYRTGRGVTRNYKAAYAWYYRSAEHNDHYGEWGLAYMYQRGHGVKKDVTEAMKWYRKAEVGLPKNESLKRVIALTDLQAFLESPTSKTLNISALRSAFFWPLVIGLYLFAAVYVAIGVILLCYSLRKPYPPGILVALGWIVFYFESQGVATLAVMIAGNSLLADVLIGSIAVFGAVPVIGSTLGASRSRVWKSSPLPWRTLLAYASALCLALIALGFIHEKVSSLISHSPLPPQSTMALFEKSKEASAWVTFACVALVIPIAEEVLFRSYLFDALRRHLPGSATIFITAFLFAFVHFQLLYFLPLFVMGLVFGLARLKTDSLRPSILLHILNNAVVLAAFHY